MVLAQWLEFPLLRLALLLYNKRSLLLHSKMLDDFLLLTYTLLTLHVAGSLELLLRLLPPDSGSVSALYKGAKRSICLSVRSCVLFSVVLRT